MNGCCHGHADGGGHDATCYWYWPCGCRKERSTVYGQAKPHTHPATTYVEWKDRNGPEQVVGFEACWSEEDGKHCRMPKGHDGPCRGRC